MTYEIVGQFNHIEICEQKNGVGHRRVVGPLDDTANESAEIKALVAEHHTPEVKAAYQAHLTEQATRYS